MIEVAAVFQLTCKNESGSSKALISESLSGYPIPQLMRFFGADKRSEFTRVAGRGLIDMMDS